MTTILHFADNAGMLRHKTQRKRDAWQRARAQAIARCHTTGERPPSTLVAVPVM